MRKLIKNADIVNEGRIFKGSVLIHNDLIEKVFEAGEDIVIDNSNEIIDA